MSPRFALLAAIACLATASPALAQPPAPTAPAELRMVQEKAALYSTLLMEGRQLAIDVVERIGAISQASIRGGGDYDGAWAGPMRTRAAALKARIDALPPFTAAEVASVYAPGSAGADRAVELIADYPEVLKSTFAAAEHLIAEIDAKGPGAQKGEEAATLALAGAMFEGMRAAVAAENLQLELSATTFEPVHPQQPLTESAIFANEAMMEFFSLMQRQAEGRAPDLVSAARRIRSLSEEGRRTAETVPDLADGMKLAMEIEAAGRGRPLSPAVLSVIDSYRRSAANEIAITDHLATLALALAEKGLGQTAEDAWEDIEVLTEKRFELERERRGALSR